MQTLLHTGIYSIPEAARLTDVSTWRIRRWMRGYEFKATTGQHSSPPLWKGELEPIDHALALGFHDLIEVRCVNALLQAGVSWPTLRRAHEHATKLVGHPHPFSTGRFATDGQTVFLRFCKETSGESVWDMRDIQRVFEEIITPFLRNVEFSKNDIAFRWWPMGQAHQIVLDPQRSFGRPIVAKHGVPTAVLAAAMKAEGNIKSVAQWYAVSTVEVEEAVAFEARLAA